MDASRRCAYAFEGAYAETCGSTRADRGTPPHHAAQPLELLASMESPELGRDGALRAGRPGHRVAGNQAGAAEDARPGAHLEDAAEDLPDRMAADEVVLPGRDGSAPQEAAIGRAHRAVVDSRLRSVKVRVVQPRMRAVVTAIQSMPPALTGV